MTSFNKKVLKCIPANIFMISSSADSQISHEAYNTGGFQLPDPNGKKGGACTSAILQVLYERGHEVGKNLSWVEVLQDMYTQLKKLGYDQIPQLSSSRWIDVHSPMHIVPPKSGKRRALLIGINYVGHGIPGELSACQNDCENLKDYLIKAQGFQTSEMLILKDDGHHLMPTKKNIFDGFVRLTQYSQPGDVVFVSFSGHGGRVVDTSGDEDDGYDESLIPVDFRENGQIVDDDILKYFCKRLKGGVHVTVVMDCCHSGTVMDLPYTFPANEKTMQIEKGFLFDDDTPRTNKKKIDDSHRSSNGGSSTKGNSKKEKPKQRKKTIAEQPMKPPEPRKPTDDLPVPPPPPGCCSVM